MVTGHYKEILRAKDTIKTLIKAGHNTEDDIVFYIGEKFGFGKKMVTDYIRVLTQRDFCLEHEGKLMTYDRLDLLKELEAKNEGENGTSH